jgi:Flp pilus assembly protein TadG
MFVLIRNARKNNGLALVETALCLPLLLIFLVAIVYFGKLFYTCQITAYASQQGARLAGKLPNLQDAGAREKVRGFTLTGKAANRQSIIYRTLSCGHLLTNGSSGDLPTGSKILILPYDNLAGYTTPPGTVSVVIAYQFRLLQHNDEDTDDLSIPVPALDSQKQSPRTLSFPSFTLTEQATVPRELYEEEI